MLKRLLTTVLCALALTTVCAHAQTVQNGNRIVFDESAEYRIAAAYDSNGKMLGLQSFSDSTGEIDYKKMIGNTDRSVKIKIFSWNKNLEPMSYIIENNEIVLEADAFEELHRYYDDYAANMIADFGNLYYYDSADMLGELSEYKLADGEDTKNEAELYVNGVKVEWNEENVQKYIVDNKVGNVTLIDAPLFDNETGEQLSGTDGYYDYVCVDHYKSAVVSIVDEDTVYFDLFESGFSTHIIADSTKECSVTLDGTQINISELQEDDIVSVAYDVTGSADQSSFYNILVNRGVVSGVIERSDDEETYYMLDGKKYIYDEDLLPDGYSDEAVGMKAELYVDVFGRIVLLNESSTSKKYAILENAWYDEGAGVYKAKLILPDGSECNYEFKEEEDVYYALDIIGYDNKYPVGDRVIQYKLNSKGLIYNIVTYEDSRDVIDTYDAKSNRIGNIKLGENTKLLYMSDYISSGKVNDIISITSEALIADNQYAAFGYDKLSDSTYAFVLITDGEVNIQKEPVIEDAVVVDTAILESLYYDEGTYSWYTLFTETDGSFNVYTIKNDEEIDELTDLTYVAEGTRKNASERVVSYKVDSENNVHSVVLKTAESVAFDAVYSDGTIDEIKIGENTSIIDATQANVSTGTQFAEGESYSVCGYDKDEDGTYKLVIVTAGELVYNETSEESTTIECAILENVWFEAGPGVYKAKLILPDNIVADYEIKDDSDYEELAQICFVDGISNYKTQFNERVISCKINASGKMHSAELQYVAQANGEMYDAENNKIGDLKVGPDTIFIDTSNYAYTEKISDYRVIPKPVFSENTSYTAFGLGEKPDGTYSMILITRAIGGYNDYSQTAVFSKKFMMIDEEGDACDAIQVLYDGEVKEFLNDGCDIYDLDRGDIIAIALDIYGNLTDLQVIAHMEVCNGTARLASDNRPLEDIELMPIDAWNVEYNEDTKVELNHGVIVGKNESSITLTPYNGEASASNKKTYSLDENTKVYVYNYGKNPKNELSIGTISDITESDMPESAVNSDTGDIIWSEVENNEDIFRSVNCAFVKAIDGTAQEVFVVLGPADSVY